MILDNKHRKPANMSLLYLYQLFIGSLKSFNNYVTVAYKIFCQNIETKHMVLSILRASLFNMNDLNYLENMRKYNYLKSLNAARISDGRNTTTFGIKLLQMFDLLIDRNTFIKHD